MQLIKAGDTVIRTTPFQNDEIGEPMEVGDKFTVAAVFASNSRIAFSLFGKSYKTEYFKVIKN